MGQIPDLSAVAVFVKVVEHGSFRGAAKAMAMPKSTVSRKVAELEERLGARLLQRTTRTLRLTDVGEQFHRRCARILSELEDAEHGVREMQEAPRGLLRVTAPLGFRYLGPIVTELLAQHPELRVEVVCTDRMVDLVDEGFDAAIRFGKLADSSLVARSLGTGRRLVVAAPSYLRAHGGPSHPRELAEHDCLVFGAGPERERWRLESRGKPVDVAVRARLVANDFDALDDACRAGLGIAMLPSDRCASAVREGVLEHVLPDWASPETPAHVVYPSTRHLSPKVRVFVDHLVASMSPPPWERG